MIGCTVGSTHNASLCHGGTLKKTSPFRIARSQAYWSSLSSSSLSSSNTIINIIIITTIMSPLSYTWILLQKKSTLKCCWSYIWFNCYFQVIVLYLSENGTLTDCNEVEDVSIQENELVQDYKKLSRKKQVLHSGSFLIVFCTLEILPQKSWVV